MNKVIGYVSQSDPFHDKVAWSGLIYKIRESIELAGFEVRWIPYGQNMNGKILSILLKVWNRIFARKSKWLLSVHFRPILKLYAKELDLNTVVRECDFLFFPGGAQIALYTQVKKPVIYYTDASIFIMIGYYMNNISKKSEKMAKELELEAAQNAMVNIRASQWAIDSVIEDCHCDKNRCFVLEFGPNVDTMDMKRNIPYDGGELKILFSGVDWRRKGGDIAVETVELLRGRGIDARLIVAGPRECPQKCQGKQYIEFVGFLNKNNKEDYQRYLKLYESSHIFLLPTKAECAGVVFAEASAMGLPCYTYLTGGTGNYVVSGVNGYALPEGSSAKDFAEQIFNDIKTEKLQILRDGGVNLFKNRLSWEAWQDGFAKIMKTIS